MDPASFVAPSHVPPDLIVPFDQLNGPEVMAFPPTAALGVGRERPVFYSSFYGGFWVFTRYEQIRAIYQDPVHFKQWSQGLPVNPYTKLYKPLFLDPPEHMPWRRVLTPLFSPRQLARFEDFVRGLARERIAAIAPLGRCEFVEAFADVLPGQMFCFQLGLSNDEYPRFSRMAHDLVFGPAQVIREGGDLAAAKAIRARANKEIDDFIGELVPDRRRNPGEDIISVLLQGEVDGRPLEEEEIVNLTTLLFFAGTDSTRASITYAFKCLAERPALRDQLVRGEVTAKQASEELLRLHGFHFTSREVAKDIEVGGVRLKAGDVVLLSTGAANRDAAKFAEPETPDLNRAQAHSHLTFGAGIHRCIGSHLATLQLRVALEEVHKVITDYVIDEDAPPVRFVSGQGKTIPENLPLRFTPVRAALA